MKWILVVLGSIALLVGIAFGIGSVVPREHTASRSAVYSKDANTLWQVITNFSDYPTWRTDVESVRKLEGGGRTGWVETTSMGELPLEIVEEVRGEKLVLRIASSDLPFGGTWTYVLAPAGGGTRLTITEDGHVDNALFRFMARFVFGYSKTLEDYLRDLGEKLGESVTVQPAAR